MPWQELVCAVATEVMPDGRPAFREVVVTVPRQHGKTLLMLVIALDRLLMWSTPQTVVYTAQSGKAARDKFVKQHTPLIDASPLKAGVERFYKADGNTGMVMRNKSWFQVAPNDDSAGHGLTVDLAFIDEAWDDVDDHREQAFRPAMRTRRDAQLWNLSTAGTERSTYLLRKVELGRAAVDAGKTTGLAFFEWSAPDEADPDDPATWVSCNPAIGYTIDLETIEADRESMTDGAFRRAVLNQWTSVDESIIPGGVWDLVRGGPGPQGRVVLAVDAAPDQSSSSIAVSDREGRAELIAHHPGTGWLLDELARLAKSHKARVAIGTSSPVKYLLEDLPKRSVRVVPVTPAEVGAACARFFDQVADRQVQIRRAGGDLDAVLDAARASAKRKPVGGGWMWAPSLVQDVSPLMAVTLAVSVAQSRPDPLTQIQ